VPDAPLPDPWPAPRATSPVEATVGLPGSKSLTNRALVLAALADDLDAPRAVAAVDAWVDATLGTHGLADTSDPDAAVRVHALLDAALGLSL